MNNFNVDEQDPLKMVEPSKFRQFCNHLWQEHKDEVFDWTGHPVTYTSKQFFSKNKWYIRSLYVSKSEDSWKF